MGLLSAIEKVDQEPSHKIDTMIDQRNLEIDDRGDQRRAPAQLFLVAQVLHADAACFLDQRIKPRAWRQIASAPVDTNRAHVLQSVEHLAHLASPRRLWRPPQPGENAGPFPGSLLKKRLQGIRFFPGKVSGETPPYLLAGIRHGLPAIGRHAPLWRNDKTPGAAVG